MNSEDVKAVARLMIHTAQQSLIATEPLLERFCKQCMDLLDLVLDDSHLTVRDTKEDTVLRARQVMLQFIADTELDVGTIAFHLNLSASSLTRAFRLHGMSPIRYLWCLRLEQAAQILRSPFTKDVQTKEVAFRCGFGHAAHFSRAFKTQYGVSPRVYKNQTFRVHDD